MPISRSCRLLLESEHVDKKNGDDRRGARRPRRRNAGIGRRTEPAAREGGPRCAAVCSPHEQATTQKPKVIEFRMVIKSRFPAG